MIYILENMFPKELIVEIKESTKGVIEKNISPTLFNRVSNRGGQTISISKEESLKELDKKISQFMETFSNNFIKYTFRPSFSSADSGYEYHKYSAGDSCAVHSDGEIVFGKNEINALIRYATVIVHLNTVKNGGETIFPNQEKTIKSIEGQIVVFPPYGNYPHYVTKSNEEREILMTWFVYNGINATKTI